MTQRPLSSLAGRAVALRQGFSGAAGLGRSHWLFLLLLTAGAALRAVTFFAYRPAIFGPDSYWYLGRSENLQPPEIRPIGYPGFLRLLPLENELAVVPFVQHLLGLLIAVLIYAVLIRLGVRRWLAALAAAPVLLDAYQLNVEQQILSETLFELLVVAGCAALLWRQPPGVMSSGLAGLLFAGAALTRTIGVSVIVPSALAVLFLRARPFRPLPVLALVAAFAVPLAAYATWFHSVHGRYTLTSYGGRFLYGRVVRFADCDKFSVPERQRVLCPDQSGAEQLTIPQLLWAKKVSPVKRVKAPPGKSRNDVAGAFAKRAILNQPGAYARAVASDFVFGFAPVKKGRPGDFGVRQWQFQLTYPIFVLGSLCPPADETTPTESPNCTAKRGKTNAIIRDHADKRGYADPGLASFLRTYQRFAYTPGPLLGAGLLAGLLAALGIGRARRSGLRVAALLFAGVALAVYLGSVAATVFSWRYQLPQLVLLPPAAALALTALIGWREGEEAATEISPGSPEGRPAAPASDSEADTGPITKPASG